MRIGPMKNRITLQRAALSKDARNQPIKTWNVMATIWANVEPLSGREYWAAKVINAEVQGRITIRHYPDLRASDRALFEGRVLELVSPPMHLKEDRRVTQVLYKEQEV